MRWSIEPPTPPPIANALDTGAALTPCWPPRLCWPSRRRPGRTPPPALPWHDQSQGQPRAQPPAGGGPREPPAGPHRPAAMMVVLICVPFRLVPRGPVRRTRVGSVPPPTGMDTAWTRFAVGDQGGVDGVLGPELVRCRAAPPGRAARLSGADASACALLALICQRQGGHAGDRLGGELQPGHRTAGQAAGLVQRGRGRGRRGQRAGGGGRPAAPGDLRSRPPRCRSGSAGCRGRRR